MEPSTRADKIIEFTLRHVPFDGWTLNALKRGAADAGENVDEAIELFGAYPLAMVEYYSQMVDRQMKEAVEAKGLDTMKIRDKIATCVMTRLNIMAPYREAAQKAAVLLSLPLNAPLGTRLMFQTVDTIWYCAGDNATDFNYYSKRALLSAVYSSTLLYWFRDMSNEFSSTAEFLNRRISNVMVIPKLKGQIKSGFNSLMSPIRSFFSRG